jgi:hypothetical protein
MTEIVVPDANPQCGRCGNPATTVSQNVMRFCNGDGTYSFAPVGDYFWRCDRHAPEVQIIDSYADTGTVTRDVV